MSNIWMQMVDPTKSKKKNTSDKKKKYVTVLV